MEFLVLGSEHKFWGLQGVLGVALGSKGKEGG